MARTKQDEKIHRYVCVFSIMSDVLGNRRVDRACSPNFCGSAAWQNCATLPPGRLNYFQGAVRSVK
jgi:hypothetical protein